MILVVGAKYDLIFGFNHMDSGFTLLLFLFAFVPLLNLAWLITEIIFSFKRFKHRSKAATFLLPPVALFFLLESLAIDLYLLSQARM